MQGRKLFKVPPWVVLSLLWNTNTYDWSNHMYLMSGVGNVCACVCLWGRGEETAKPSSSTVKNKRLWQNRKAKKLAKQACYLHAWRQILKDSVQRVENSWRSENKGQLSGSYHSSCQVLCNSLARKALSVSSSSFCPRVLSLCFNKTRFLLQINK